MTVQLLNTVENIVVKREIAFFNNKVSLFYKKNSMYFVKAKHDDFCDSSIYIKVMITL